MKLNPVPLTHITQYTCWIAGQLAFSSVTVCEVSAELGMEGQAWQRSSACQ